MDLRYPIGPFDDHAPITADMRQPAITKIAIDYAVAEPAATGTGRAGRTGTGR